MLQKPLFSLELKDSEWLKEYCFKWYSKLISQQSPYWERYGLTCYEQFETLSIIYQINIIENNIKEIAGYVIVSKVEKDILSNIYIHPRYRRKGLSTEIINCLDIKRLSCIRENVNAVRLYETLGFKEVQTNDPFKGSIKMKRD